MATKKPIIFQFSLGHDSRQRDIGRENDDELDPFSRAIRQIKSAGSKGATIKTAWTLDEALHLMNHEEAPHAILITDPAITWEVNAVLSGHVVQYCRNGGTCILTSRFASNVFFDEFNAYMDQHWGLPWKFHSYTREDCAINISAKGRRDGAQWLYGLQALQRWKASYISGVAPEACWYLPAPNLPENEDDEEEMERCDASNAMPRTQTPVAFARVGKGYLGYTGDVNQDASTQAVVLSMLDLTYT